MNYNPTQCKRRVRESEVIELEHGITNVGFCSGETCYAGSFRDEEGEEVELPDGVVVRRVGGLRSLIPARFSRPYTIHRSRNPEYQPDHPFFGLVTSIYPECLEMRDIGRNTLYTEQIPRRLRFEVVRTKKTDEA